MLILVAVCLVPLIIFIVLAVNVSDFGESSQYLTDTEYEETCKDYQKFFDERKGL